MASTGIGHINIDIWGKVFYFLWSFQGPLTKKSPTANNKANIRRGSPKLQTEHKEYLHVFVAKKDGK